MEALLVLFPLLDVIIIILVSLEAWLTQDGTLCVFVCLSSCVVSDKFSHSHQPANCVVVNVCLGYGFHDFYSVRTFVFSFFIYLLRAHGFTSYMSTLEICIKYEQCRADET